MPKYKQQIVINRHPVNINELLNITQDEHGIILHYCSSNLLNEIRKITDQAGAKIFIIPNGKYYDIKLLFINFKSISYTKEEISESVATNLIFPMRMNRQLLN